MKHLYLTVDFVSPQKKIKQFIEKSGGKAVGCATTYNGARFDFLIENIIDEKVFKKQLIEVLKKCGYRAY